VFVRRSYKRHMGFLPELGRLLTGLGYQVDITGFLVVFGLMFARLVTVISMAPFAGGKSTPNNIKVGLAVILAAVLYPSVAASHTADVPQGVAAIALLAKEVLIGAALGLASQMVFFGVQMAGAVIDLQRGMSQMEFVAPQLQGNTSVLGLLQFQMALVVFVIMGGHLMFIRVLSDSFTTLPLTTLPHLPAGGLAVAQLFGRISADMFILALGLCAPVLIVLVLVDATFGAVNRAAQQVHANQESQPVKALAGLGVLLLSAGFLMGRMIPALQSVVRLIHDVAGAMGGG
jgi:flagellar biosynthetic protein FliR